MSRSVVAVLLVSCGAAMGALLAGVAPKPNGVQAIEWLNPPRSVMDFSLATDGGVFNKRSLSGRWSIVLFGFLHCPDACPTALLQMAKLATRLADGTAGTDVAFVFVSVDPGRDAVVEVAQFVRHFDSSIIGVSGSEEQLAKFSRNVGVQFSVSPGQDNYRVTHSTGFSIIDPEGNFRGRFRAESDVLRLASELASKFDAESF